MSEPTAPVAAPVPAAVPAPSTPAAPSAPDVTAMSSADTVSAILAGNPSLLRPDAPEPPPAPPPAAAAPLAPAPEPPPAPDAPPPAEDMAARIERAMAARAETQERLMRLEQFERDAQAHQQAAEQARYELEQVRSMARDNLPALLQQNGWTPEAIVAAMVDATNPRPEVVRGNQMEQRLAQIEQANHQLREEIAQRDHATKVERFMSGIVPAIAAKSDTYSHTLAFFDPGPLSHLVYSEIEREYQGSGGRTVLTVEQAADRIESQLRARVTRVKGSGNVASAPVAAPQAAPVPQTTPSAPRTLTNDLTSSTGHAPEFNPLDDEARLSAAAEMLRKGWSQ